MIIALIAFSSLLVGPVVGPVVGLLVACLIAAGRREEECARSDEFTRQALTDVNSYGTEESEGS